jgi:hypothetical protein
MPELFTITSVERDEASDWTGGPKNKQFHVYRVGVRSRMASAEEAECSRLPTSPVLQAGDEVEGELIPQGGDYPPKFKVAASGRRSSEPHRMNAASNIAAPAVPGTPAVSYGEQRVSDYERQLMIVHQHSQTVAASVLGEGGPEQVMQLAQILTDDVLDLPTRLAERKRAEALAKEHDEEIPF